MAGHVFAVSKAYFLDIKGYDTGLQMGGGENIEISFKVRNISLHRQYPLDVSI